MRTSTFLFLILVPTATQAAFGPSTIIINQSFTLQNIMATTKRTSRELPRRTANNNNNYNNSPHRTALQMANNNSPNSKMEKIQDNLKRAEARRLALEAEIALAEETKIMLLREALRAEDISDTPELSDLVADLSAVADGVKKKLLREAETRTRAASISASDQLPELELELNRAKLELRQLLQEAGEGVDRAAGAVPFRDVSIFVGGFAAAIAFRSTLEGRSKKVDENKRASIAKAVAKVDAQNRAVAMKKANSVKKNKWSF